MAQAFAPAPAATTDSEVGAEKQPKDATVPLPADITGSKTLDKGEMKWTLKAENHSQARADIDFKPDATKVEAKTVSFGQTVVNKVGTGLAYAGGTAADPGLNKAKFQPFEEDVTKKRADHLVDSENDPFYGAEWDQTNKKWKQERADWKIGSSTKGGTSKSASMFDTPGTPWAREGHGDVSIEFETVPMVLETREALGALLWGYKVKDEENAPIELTGGQDADCTDTPSASWAATMDKFYEAKFAEILDDFDIAKADLKPDHKTKLDNIVTKLKANAVLKAQLGGAADLTGDEEFNKALSLKRATAARDYLVGKGIDAARLEVQSYGFDWARVEAAKGTSEGKNRRVQIWVH
jgi:outer membrane protein OmpA-like peptidoglycan-associated protein/acyl dehydratase